MKTPEKIFNWQNGLLLISLALIFAVGLKTGFSMGQKKANEQAKQIIKNIKPIRENNFNFNYIFPLLSYDFIPAKEFLRDPELIKKLELQIQKEIKAGNAQKISVYVRNFTDNQQAGVGEDEQYHPGSLLKVLIMMAYYREAELNPAILQKSFTYTQEADTQNRAIPFSSPTELKVGKTYGVLELMKDMIAKSDNGAEALLILNVNRDILNSAYNDLSIPNPDSTSADYTISARQYSAFMRILYNSTYLAETYSEQALSFLAESTFKDGLAAGLPAEVKIAHKFGERVEGTQENISSIELHDCGIVYAPGHPYSICVMTKGTDVNSLAAAIKNISSLTYNYLSSK